MSNFISYSDRWFLIECFIKEKGLVRQHLDSYNALIEHGLQKIIDEIGMVSSSVGDVIIKFGKITIGEPIVREVDGTITNIYPMEARLRNLTYAAPLYLEMSVVEGGIEYEPSMVYIGDFPVMVKSSICRLSKLSLEELIARGEDPNDPGGYFIINGSERVIVTQEDLAVNKVLVDYGPSGSSVTHVAKVFSSTGATRSPVTLERLKNGTIQVSVPHLIPGKIPLIIMMRALGLEKDKEILDAVTDDPILAQELYPSFNQASSITCTDDALDFIGGRIAVGQPREVRIQRAKQLLDTHFLPHLGSSPANRIRKAYFLGQMACRLLELANGYRKPDDKDHYANKRLRLAGDLLASVFRVAFRSLCKDLKYQLDKMRGRIKKINLETLIRTDIITERLKHALATGNWVGGKVGVSQLLDRTNIISTLSHLRRVVSPLSRTQPHFEARDLHATQWGRLCPNESPEGPNCGLIKHLSLMSYISVGTDPQPIYEFLVNAGVIPIQKARSEGIRGAKVFLNGELIGIHPKGEQLVNLIRRARRNGELSDEVNVALYDEKFSNEIYVNCDSGRVRRPLIIVDKCTPKLKADHIDKLRKNKWEWKDLIANGIIEYLDADEEENAYIAIDFSDITEEHTHVEIATPAIFGIAASIICYPEHNQSPRNSYECAMAKQALSFSASNLLVRFDSRAHLLHYPQKPLVTTEGIKLIGYDKRPAGQNFIVAILCYGGYNMEDAIILNKSSVDRGLARSTFFRCYETEEKKYVGGLEDKIEIPPEDVEGYRSPDLYRYLSEDGIVEPEVEVKGGSVLIGKTSPPRFAEGYIELSGISMRRHETSIIMRHGETGIVDSVLITESMDGNKLVKVRVRDLRIPELGDKFASRHGQKGVVGLLVSQEDMPFTKDGLVPDLIINPHAIPARMTVGQLIETIAGKVACLLGREINGTAFYGEKEKDLREWLKKLGFSSTGKEILYDGITGEKYEAEIFIGVVYYQKLHHMVADKIHARARGPVQILTRQPTEGRAREGGLRFGEMERDCLIAHGASSLLKERLLEESDLYQVYVCNNCGLLAYYDKNKDRLWCSVCGDGSKVTSVMVSYAFKLLLQELMSLGIAPKLVIGERV